MDWEAATMFGRLVPGANANFRRQCSVVWQTGWLHSYICLRCWPCAHWWTGELAIWNRGYHCRATKCINCSEQILSCGLGGEWAGKTPVCRFVDCGTPVRPDRGNIQLINDSTTVGSVVKYHCDDDYWLVGPAELTCTKEGKWSGDAPSCECEYIQLHSARAIQLPILSDYALLQWSHAKHRTCRLARMSSVMIITSIRPLNIIATLAIYYVVKLNWNAWKMGNGAARLPSANTLIVAHCNLYHTDRSDTYRIAPSLGRRQFIHARIRTNCKASISEFAKRTDRGAAWPRNVKRFVALNRYWRRIASYLSLVMIACTDELWYEQPILVRIACKPTSKNVAPEIGECCL